MGFINNLLSGHWENSFGGGVGSFMNDITGQKQSAKQQYKYNQALQTNAQEFSKWQMQNAHQTEIQDLQNAGLNPVLSANAGASAGVGGGSTGAGVASGNPIEMLGAVVNMMNTSKQTTGTIENLKKQNDKIENEIDNDTRLTDAKIRNLDANTGKTNYDTDLDKSNNINGNTPYPIKMLNSARKALKTEVDKYKENSKKPGWTGWKNKARLWLMKQ